MKLVEPPDPGILVPLTGAQGTGLFTRVDAEIAPFLEVHRCTLESDYVYIWVEGERILLSRFVMQYFGLIEDHHFVDHHHHDLLDNRKASLRAASNRENLLNMQKTLGRTSFFMGVCILVVGEFHSSIRILELDKTVSLGEYKSEAEAAYAYRLAALRRDSSFFSPDMISLQLALMLISGPRRAEIEVDVICRLEHGERNASDAAGIHLKITNMSGVAGIQNYSEVRKGYPVLFRPIPLQKQRFFGSFPDIPTATYARRFAGFIVGEENAFMPDVGNLSPRVIRETRATVITLAKKHKLWRDVHYE